MAISIVIAVIVLLLLAAVSLTLRLLRSTGRWIPWAIFPVAIAALAVWQSVTLYRVATGSFSPPPDMTTAMFAAVTTSLLVAMLYRGGQVLTGMRQANEDLRRSQQTLSESEERLKILFEDAPDGCYVMDLAGRFVDGNRAAEELIGYPRGDMIGSSFLDLQLLSAEDLAAAAGALSVSATGEPIGPVEYELRRKDGGRIMVEIRTYPVTIEGESLVLGVARDISARRQAEKGLREHEARLLNAQRVAAMGDWLWQIETGELSWSEQTYALFGLSHDEFDQTFEGFRKLVHPDDMGLLEDRVDAALKGRREYSVDHRIVLPGGETRHVHENGEVTRDELGEPVSMVGTVIDITERKLAEEQIRDLNEELEERVRKRTSDLEAAVKDMESFSYAVSHDLRQPLRTINGFVQLLAEDVAAALDPSTRAHLDRIREGASRMGQMIDDLLQLARVGKAGLSREEVNLSQLARDVVSDLETSDSGRSVEVCVQDGLTDDGDEGLLTVLLQNLLGNAWKFTAGREAARIEFGARRVEGRDTIYYVGDNGIGFDSVYAGRIFGAFQQLHHANEFDGTGIGLATVERIVRHHGGRVWAEAAVNEGATFSFTLHSHS